MAKYDQNWWKQQATKAGLDEAATSTLLSAIQKPEFENAIYEGFVPRDEFSRGMDESRKAAADAAKAKADYEGYYAQNLKWYEDNQARLKAADRLLSGQDPFQQGAQQQQAQPQGDWVPKAELDSRMNNMWTVQKSILKAQSDYFSRFGKHLDIDKFEQFALEEPNRNRPVMDAYKDFISPDLEAKQKADLDEQLKKAKEEGYKDGLSKAMMPNDDVKGTSPDASGPFWTKQQQGDDANHQQQFVRDFVEAGQQS